MVRLIRRRGLPFVEIGGEVIAPAAFRSYRPKPDNISLSRRCGLRLYQFIVSGLPKNMNGTVGPQAEKVMAFCELLKERIGCEVEYSDERLTTMLVERTLIEADMSRQKRRKVVDKLAAVNILQVYLDSHHF